jgi:hypothetical protein
LIKVNSIALFRDTRKQRINYERRPNFIWRAAFLFPDASSSPFDYLMSFPVARTVRFWPNFPARSLSMK